jgi:hypothetical protein
MGHLMKNANHHLVKTLNHHLTKECAPCGCLVSGQPWSITISGVDPLPEAWVMPASGSGILKPLSPEVVPNTEWFGEDGWLYLVIFCNENGTFHAEISVGPGAPAPYLGGCGDWAPDAGSCFAGCVDGKLTMDFVTTFDYGGGIVTVSIG